MAVLSLILLASAQALSGAVAAALPGGDCQVSHCCDEWSAHFAHIHAVAAAEHDASHGITFTTPVSGACSLLGLTDNITGVCGDVPDALDVATVLKDHALAPSKPLLGTVVEPGTCSELTGGACWQSPNESTVLVDWTNKRYYPMGAEKCMALMLEENPTVAWSTTCATEEPYGLKVRAKWVDGINPGIDLCGSEADSALLELVTSDMWTSTDGLTRWRCFDVPQTPSGTNSHRILAYAHGPAPCTPAESSTTHAPVVSGSARLGALMATFAVTFLAALQ